MAGGRPTPYNEEMLAKAKEYLELCQDEEKQVKLPTRGGLARHLDVSRDTLYEWAKVHPEFSDIMEAVGAEQEDRLISKGLAGTYNPTITKVLLTKHGYREGHEHTGAEGQPLFDAEQRAKAEEAIKELLEGEGDTQ